MRINTPTEPEVSIVLPCLNEARTLAGCIEEAIAALNEAGLAGEVIVADNGSTDGSIEIATAAGARVIPVASKGYGHALRAGITAAKGKYIVMGDADASYDFGHVPRFIERLRTGADLVMGNRFKGGILPGAMPWKNRYIGNPILSFIGQLLFRTGAGDFHCGLRGFSQSAYTRMDLRATGMEFASEMVVKAALLGLRVEEVPTVLRPDGRGRPPHLRPWRDGWRHLRFMLLFSPRWLFLYPGLLMMTLGSTAGCLLLLGPVHVGNIIFDTNTLLFAACAILVGFQAVAFAILGKFFTIRSGLRAPEAGFERNVGLATLETGLLVGGTLLFGGLALALTSVWFWREQSFGSLDPSHILRWVIPGATCITLGCQIILTSFFLSVLRLDTRE